MFLRSQTLLLIVRPGAPSSVLASSVALVSNSKALVTRSDALVPTFASCYPPKKIAEVNA